MSSVLSRFPRTLSTLALLGVLGLSSCAKTPDAGVMLDHLPTPAKAEEAKSSKKIYATPVPTEPDPTVTPGPLATPEPKPPTPPVKKPPTNPPVGPPVRPTPRPSAVPTKKIPTPTPLVTPVAPVTPGKKLEVPPDLLTIYTRAFAQAFGVYDDGHLVMADKIPLAGQGYLKVFQDRDRGYGSLDLVTIILAAAKEIHREIPATEVVQIGDIAAKRGGQLGGHGSHQNGLDADIVYFKKNHRVMPTSGSSRGETGFDEKFVDRNGAVTANFDIDANWKFIQILATTNRIDRIFADQHIKREFCRYAVAKGMREEWKETLRKLRHWPNHQDHMHVRLTCPPNSGKCKPIPPIPDGDGCDSLLDRSGNGGGGIILRMEGELPGFDEHGESPNEHGC